MGKWRALEAITVIRSLAIVFVVANHSQFGINLHGGLNILLVISGLSLARFSFMLPTQKIIHSMFRIGTRVALPSFFLALIWQIGVGKLSFPELAFYSNWLYKSRVALFPIWYPQALTQMLLVFGVLFWATDMGRKIADRPLFWVSLLYILCCVVTISSLLLWDTRYLADKLPHLIAWNFMLGWLIWAVREEMERVAARVSLTIVFLLTLSCVFILTDADNAGARAIIMPMLFIPLIWIERIKLPPLLARLSALISQSTFSIFLFHYYAFWAIWRIGRLLGFEALAQHPAVRLFVGVAGPVLLWAIWAAAVRVYRRGYRLWPLRMANMQGGRGIVVEA